MKNVVILESVAELVNCAESSNGPRHADDKGPFLPGSAKVVVAQRVMNRSVNTSIELEAKGFELRGVKFEDFVKDLAKRHGIKVEFS